MIQKLKSNIKKAVIWFGSSFSRKIMSILLICMSLVILVSSTVYYYNSTRLLKKEYISANRELLQEVNQGVQRYFEQLNDVTRSLYSDDTFINNLRERKNDYLSLAYNEKVIKNILYADDNIQYIYFYTPYNETLYSFPRQNVSHSVFPEVEQKDWYQKTASNDHYFYLEPLHKFENYKNFGSLQTENVFSTNRVLRYFETGEMIGMISISYRADYLEKICRNLDSSSGYLAVLDDNLDPLFISWPDLRLPASIKKALQDQDSSDGHYYYSLNNEKRILLWDKLEDFYILKDIPLNELTRNTVMVLRLIVIFSVVVFFVSVLISFWVTRSATRKLKRLTETISEFGNGALTIDETDYGNDEIGILATAFHDMTERINELINLEYKAQVLKKSAELQALQAQVKPHYINNALQAMGTLGLKKGATDVYLMANALAKNMRYSLKSTTQLVPLKQEIENMNDYLFIQKILWDNRLTVTINTQKDTENCLVPVFILQPLVENSIKHGLDSCHQGHIDVEIKADDSVLSITVCDDGRGIPPASLRLLQEWLNEPEIQIAADEHIGIRNINNRIRLIYGDKGTFTIDSPSEGGTVIHIILPNEVKNNV